MPFPIEDTVFDPVEESLTIQVKLDSYFIWEDEPPDSSGFFSQPDNYSWLNRQVTIATDFQPEYKSVSPLYFFDREINPVYFWLYDPENEIDTISQFVITYNKPRVELVSVESADQVEDNPSFVVYKSNPGLTVKAESLFPSAEETSFIKEIRLRVANTSFYYTLWEDATGAGQIEINEDLPPAFSLAKGEPVTFSLSAIGRSKAGYTGPLETSDEVFFTLTYMAIDVPDTICQVNSNISLNAYPPGGRFEGKGIVDNTNLFNPSQADTTNTFITVTYKHIIEGTEFSVSEDIYIIDLPVVELDGDFEVCANSTDKKYTILNAETSKYDYKWHFTGIAEVIDSTDISMTVRWQSEPASYTGKISISLKGKSETQCPAAFEYLVDIDPDDAPDKPCVCFGDISRRLLLASNTEAAYYEWYIHDGDLLKVTPHPYLYLTDSIRKYNNIGETTIFDVHIANQLTGCYTTGYMCEEEICNQVTQNSVAPQEFGDALSVDTRENPVREILSLTYSGTYTGTIDIRFYNSNGILVSSYQLTKTMPAEDHTLHLDAGLSPGLYLVVCHYGNNRTSPVKMIVY
jgi:hypothetical protein